MFFGGGGNCKGNTKCCTAGSESEVGFWCHSDQLIDKVIIVVMFPPTRLFLCPSGLQKWPSLPQGRRCCPWGAWVTVWSEWTPRRSSPFSLCRTSVRSCLEVRSLSLYFTAAEEQHARHADDTVARPQQKTESLIILNFSKNNDIVR